MRLGLGLGLGRNPLASTFQVPSASLKLALVPESIVSSGGVVTSWRDISGNNNHGTPTGSPLLDSSQVVPGVIFDAVNDRIDGAIATADQPLTVFILKKMAVDIVDYAYVLDISDTGASNRSFMFVHIYGNPAVRQSQIDSGASWLSPSTNLVLERGDMSVISRSIWRDGYWKNSAGIPGDPVRTSTVYRLGRNLGGTNPWNGSIFAVLVYAGAMAEIDKRAIQRKILVQAGLATPFVWPIAASTDLISSPRFILPSILPAIAGRRIQIWKDSVHLRDGVDASQVATSDLTLERMPSDRWAVTPASAGDSNFTVNESGFSASMTIRAVAMLAVDAAKKRILFVGDSNTARSGSGWIEYIGNDLGSSRVEMVGTKGPNLGYHYKHEGTDSKSWATYTSSGSPFFNGGASLDIPGYLAQLANPPDMIVWTLGQNDIYNADESTIEAMIDTAFVNAESLLAAFTAELPNVKHFMATNFPLAMDPAQGAGSAAARYAKHRLVHRYVERVIAQFGNREASKIYVVPTFFQVDPIDGYADAIHMNSSPGHEQLASAYLASLVTHWSD